MCAFKALAVVGIVAMAAGSAMAAQINYPRDPQTTAECDAAWERVKQQVHQQQMLGERALGQRDAVERQRQAACSRMVGAPNNGYWRCTEPYNEQQREYNRIGGEHFHERDAIESAGRGPDQACRQIAKAHEMQRAREEDARKQQERQQHENLARQQEAQREAAARQQEAQRQQDAERQREATARQQEAERQRRDMAARQEQAERQQREIAAQQREIAQRQREVAQQQRDVAQQQRAQQTQELANAVQRLANSSASGGGQLAAEPKSAAAGFNTTYDVMKDALKATEQGNKERSYANLAEVGVKEGVINPASSALVDAAYVKRNDNQNEAVDAGFNSIEAVRAVVPGSEVSRAIADEAFKRLNAQVQQTLGDVNRVTQQIDSLRGDAAAASGTPSPPNPTSPAPMPRVTSLDDLSGTAKPAPATVECFPIDDAKAPKKRYRIDEKVVANGTAYLCRDGAWIEAR